MTQKQPNPKIVKPKVSYPVLEKTKYYLVSFPEIQQFMMHPRWDECIFCTEVPGHPCADSTYAVPESLYEEVMSL